MTLLCAGIVLQRTATDLIESSLGNGEREKGKFLFGLRSSPVFLVSSSPSLKRLIRRKLCHGIFHFQNRIFSPNQKEISNPGGERRWWKMYGKCDGPGVIESHFGSETSDRKWKKRKVHSWWKIIRVSSVCNIPSSDLLGYVRGFILPFSSFASQTFRSIIRNWNSAVTNVNRLRRTNVYL